MKILILQLARLGDIYQSWPAIRGLRRLYPDAQIDVLVRPRFVEALDGLEGISNRILLPSAEVIAPILSYPQDIQQSLTQVEQFINKMKKTNYDWIINFSFSPLSSYLVHALSTRSTQISGYTRHRDGYLDMSGEVAAYFFAQVGISRFNRFHITDLLAGMIGVELKDDDWKDPLLYRDDLTLPDQYVVMHVGASENQKSLPAFKWSRIIKFFHELVPNIPVVLVGSQGEKHLADFIMAGRGKSTVIDLVGKTRVSDLFPILRDASLLVGCDSAPIHIAGLTKTPCLNLSLGQVNFWETGPRSPRSYVFRAETIEQVVSEYVSMMMSDIVNGQAPQGLIRYNGQSPCYEVFESPEQRFAWELILAVYLGQVFPMADDAKFIEGCDKLNAMNEVIIEQLQMVDKHGIDKVKPILDRGDEIINAIGEIVPTIQVYTRWLKAERTRLVPGTIEDLVQGTLKMHISLRNLIRPYVLDEPGVQEGGPRG